MFRPFRACINFVASFVGDFVAFVEHCWLFLTEARIIGTANGRELTRMDGVFFNREKREKRERGAANAQMHSKMD